MKYRQEKFQTREIPATKTFEPTKYPQNRILEL